MAGRSAVISCSNTAPETSSTTLTQTEPPLCGAAMIRVSTPPVAIAKLNPMSVSVGTPVASFATSCQRMPVPRWKPMHVNGAAKVFEKASEARQSAVLEEVHTLRFPSSQKGARPHDATYAGGNVCATDAERRQRADHVYSAMIARVV